MKNVKVYVVEIKELPGGHIYPIRLKGDDPWDETEIRGEHTPLGCNSEEAKQLFNGGTPDELGIVTAKFEAGFDGTDRIFKPLD